MFLGLHLGHDSNICVVDKFGRLVAYSLLERVDGIRHSGGCFSVSQFIQFCDLFSINPSDITHACITSGQHLELVFWGDSAFGFTYACNGVSPSIDEWATNNFAKLPQDKFLENTVLSGSSVGYLSYYFPEYVAYLESLRNGDNPNDIVSRVPTSVVPYVINNFDLITQIGHSFDDTHNSGFILPGFLQLNSIQKTVPCFYVDHQLAHSSSAFAKSPFENPFVFSADGGGSGGNGNLASLLNSNSLLKPCYTTNFAGGQFYSVCSQRIGLDPGKLMGLSAYHESDQLVHNQFLEFLKTENPSGGIPERFIALFEERFSCSLSPSDSKRICVGDNSNWKIGFNPIDSSLSCFAATVQSVFQSWFVHTIDSLPFSLNDFDGLVLSGGAALNCPTNQLLAEKYSQKVFIESSCNDEGLSFGAISACASLLKISDSLLSKYTKVHNRSPYQCYKPQGLTSPINPSVLQVVRLGDDWSEVVSLIASDHIGFICLGHAELGPRALGNRSIVALASNRQNHYNINMIKRRELWRPLAPIVLEDDFDKYFTGSPNSYMLMTNSVLGPTLPAITHFDNTARVQCVGPNQTNFYKLLQSLKKNYPDITPVLVNTSLNGPRQPILDSLDGVVNLLLSSTASFILTEDMLILKK